jgi:hypothetical protein
LASVSPYSGEVSADEQTSQHNRFTGGRAGTLWYYRRRVKEFRARGPAALADELATVVGEIERRAGMSSGATPTAIALEAR